MQVKFIRICLIYVVNEKDNDLLSHCFPCFDTKRHHKVVHFLDLTKKVALMIIIQSDTN